MKDFLGVLTDLSYNFVCAFHIVFSDTRRLVISFDNRELGRIFIAFLILSYKDSNIAVAPRKSSYEC